MGLSENDIMGTMGICSVCEKSFPIKSLTMPLIFGRTICVDCYFKGDNVLPKICCRCKKTVKSLIRRHIGTQWPFVFWYCKRCFWIDLVKLYGISCLIVVVVIMIMYIYNDKFDILMSELRLIAKAVGRTI